MYKKTIALSFTLLFMALIAAPIIILVLDDSIDTSIFYSITEEEENGKSKKLTAPSSIENNQVPYYTELKNQQFFGYRFKKYPKPHLNLISPPPEYIL